MANFKAVASAGVYSSALAVSANSTGRTVYIGSLPATACVNEFLNLVQYTPSSPSGSSQKNSVSLSPFLDGAAAAAFHADATIKKFVLHDQELKIG